MPPAALISLAPLQLWDLRSMKQTTEVEGAHTAPIRDLDFAHQAEHILASAGDDCRVKVWDTRFAPMAPIPLGLQ